MNSRPITELALALLALGLAGPASAQREVRTIEMDATRGTPTIDVEVKGETVRFALDPVLGGNVAVNPESAEALGLGGLPLLGSQAAIGNARVRGKTARFGITVDGERELVWAALLGRPHVTDLAHEGYDLAGGFDALPADRIVVHLNAGLTGPMQQFVFEKPRGDNETGFPVNIAGLEMRLMIHFINSLTWLDRRAAQLLVDEGQIEPVGEVRNVRVWFDLEMPVQDIRSVAPVEVNGLVIDPLQARTASPLIQPIPDEDVILVTAERDEREPPRLLVGKGALTSCVSLVYEREWRRLTLNCLAQE